MLHIASMGEEAVLLRVGAVAAAADAIDAGAIQPLPRKLVQITLPPLLRVAREGIGGLRIGEKSGSHVVAHFEIRGADGRREPRLQ